MYSVTEQVYPDVRIRFQTDNASIQRADETTSQSN